MSLATRSHMPFAVYCQTEHYATITNARGELQLHGGWQKPLQYQPSGIILPTAFGIGVTGENTL